MQDRINHNRTKIPEINIMCQNNLVCSINRQNGAVRIYKKNLLPFGLYLTEALGFEEAINNLENFHHWCAERVLNIERKYAKEILNAYGLRQNQSDKTRADIAISVRGLSLSDGYWFSFSDEKILWKDINLHQNSLSNALVDLALNGTPTITAQDLITPDISTSGVFPKAWRRINDKLFLYKGDKDDSVRKEVEASEMLKRMGFPTLVYQQQTWNDKPVSTCKCITTPDKGIATAFDVSLWVENQDQNFDEYKSQWQKDYEEMLLADYLVGNSDRHQENWGFFFRIGDNSITGIHPMMDFNHAFEANKSTRCLPEFLCGRDISQEDAAFEVFLNCSANRFEQDFSDFYYGSFVQERIAALKQRARDKILENTKKHMNP